MTRTLPRVISSLWLALALPMAQAAPPADPLAALPQAKTVGSIEMLTGGIGVSEATAMRAAAKAWPLALEFYRELGGRPAFTTGVKVSIADAQGAPVLQASSDGPYFFVKLPPGRYTVFATLGTQTVERDVEIQPGKTTRANLRWTGAAAPAAPAAPAPAPAAR